MKNTAALITALLSAGVEAFPKVNPEAARSIYDAAQLNKRVLEARSLSSTETNCGPDGPCLTFNAADQLVSVTGEHAFQSPTKSQLRGPCPGLNAAANHGYLPRSGAPSIIETITGLGQAYGMSIDLAGFLAAYAVAMDGDVISGTWSIGGPPSGGNPLPGLLGQAQGISWSHNKYEGDTSFSRADAYINNGDAYSLIPELFAQTYSYNVNDRFTLDDFRRAQGQKEMDSIAKNPYYFAPLFSTTLVAPAAYNFVINFMSNHSAEEPSGYLNGDILKTFFSVKGEYPDFTWDAAQDRIPENWYRRPLSDEYNAVNVFQDLIIGWLAYPDTFRFGGNTNGVNTYTGIDPFDLSKGTYSMDTMFEGDNFACFFFQTQQQAIPDVLKGGLNDLNDALGLINKYSDNVFGDLSCPQLAGYDATLFNKYPGHFYSPTPESNGQ